MQEISLVEKCCHWHWLRIKVMTPMSDFKTCRSSGPLLLLLQERTPLPLLLRQRCLLSSDTEVRESESWTQMMTLSGLALPRPDLLKGQWFFTTVFLSSLDPMKLDSLQKKKLCSKVTQGKDNNVLLKTGGREKPILSYFRLVNIK